MNQNKNDWERRRHTVKASDYRLYSSLERFSCSPKRAWIDLSALRRNWRVLCRLLNQTPSHARPIAVVKADAYGHGAPQCVRALLEEGCDFFAVSCIEEALVVREVTKTVGADAEILILGYTPLSQASILAEEDLIQTLSSPAYAQALLEEAERLGLQLRVHVALNTGMNRIGFEATDEEEILASVLSLELLYKRSALKIEGLFTHFATADGNSDTDHAFLNRQVACYTAFCDALGARGIQIPFHHVCNSSATLSHPELHFDGVRTGILLFGGIAHPAAPDLSPVMHLCADIVHIHRLRAGESVGYGAAYTAEKEGTVAVLPIGYADGWMRAMSGATVTLTTKSGTYRVPIIGRVCMDQCMIDVTGTDAAVGDTAHLFGSEVGDLTRLSDHAKTIPYELLCLLSSRVTRSYESENNTEK